VSPDGTNKGSIAALQAQIRHERSQLNDWVTCVSATTPKGKEEIQSLSSKIGAAKSQLPGLRPQTQVRKGQAGSTLGHSW
jgi:hypothetical protein